MSDDALHSAESLVAPEESSSEEQLNSASSQAEGRITCVNDLLQAVSGTAGAGRRWFRGQSDANWGLQPGVARDSGHMRDELTMLKQFKRDAVYRMSVRPENEWDWIAIAQHYGLPTRLLDWTEHPLVGLYFATENPGDGRDGCLFQLDPSALNLRSFPESPTLLMLNDSQLGGYLPGSTSGPRSGPLAVTSSRYFDRIVAQVGTFTVCQSGEDLADDPAVRSWKVPSTSKATIRAELIDLNVTASTVYPDLTHLTDHIKEEYRQ